MSPRRSKYSDDQVVQFFHSQGGIVAAVAKAMGITRQSLWERINKSPFLIAELKAIRENRLDLAETIVFKTMQGNPAKGIKPDVRVAQWYLEKHGKDRGYGNKIETSISTADLQEVVAAFGGDLTKLRSFRASLDGFPASSQE